MTKKVYKVKGMDCASCATILELDFEDAGIKAKCDYATEKLEVEFDDCLGGENIEKIVKHAGYGLVKI